MIDKNPYQDLKKFFIKLISIVIGIIIVINVTYNLIFAEKLESLNKILMLKDKKNIEEFKDKLRVEIEKGMEKEKILNDDDAELIYKFYNKIKKEINNAKKD
jgi:hypothetical protein|tara:strand:- start:1379 stop:1684 length:306 start_codon:yes stop_codon:yes gene_type:complete